jgi:recombination protein RecT
MVRPTQQLHPPREPAAVLPAATVLLLRDTPEGIEVLMTRRSAGASFAPGAYVFPGGRIEEADAVAQAVARRRPTQSDLQLTQSVAAVRECFEELGVLLARHPDGRAVDPAVVAAMDRSTTSAIALVDQCAAHGLLLATDQVYTLAHWITDRDLPKRFDVPFLVARMPEGQTPTADEAEQFEPCWVRPADALARHQSGGFFMIFPTLRTLERLAAYATAEAVLEAGPAAKGRCGPAARAPACCAARKRATWSTNRPSASWPWSAPTARSCTSSAGRPRRRWRC